MHESQKLGEKTQNKKWLRGLQMLQFECPRHPIPFGLGEFLFFIFLRNKGNGLWGMKDKSWKKNQNKNGLKGSKCSSLNAPGTWEDDDILNITTTQRFKPALWRAVTKAVTESYAANHRTICSVFFIPSHVVCVFLKIKLHSTPRIMYQVLLVIIFAYQGN